MIFLDFPRFLDFSSRSLRLYEDFDISKIFQDFWSFDDVFESFFLPLWTSCLFVSCEN